MSFKAMKKDRKKSLGALVEAAAKTDNNFSNNDENQWKLTVDKAQNGSAVIRFLPAPEGEDVPWVKTFSHGFKDVGGWMIDDCLTTIGKDCPVCERNSKLWEEGEGSRGRKIVSGHGKESGTKRKQNFFSNIYVVKDSANPANEGKVFLFKYGPKIHGFLKDKMNPTFEDDVAVNPFDLWDGATFRLKARKVDGQRNYDSSSFDEAGPLLDDDDAMEEIYNNMHSLAAMLDPEAFTSYDDMSNRLSKVIGNVGAPVLTVVEDQEGKGEGS